MRKTDTQKNAGMTMKDESGQSLIELALVLPIFAVLLLGAAQFGQLLYDGIEVSDAARAGVAYGSQSPTMAANTALIEQAATDSAADLPGMIANDPAPTQLYSCPSVGGAPSSDRVTVTANCALAGGTVVNYIQVNTKATVTPVIHLPGVNTSYTLTGQAIMRVAQ